MTLGALGLLPSGLRGLGFAAEGLDLNSRNSGNAGEDGPWFAEQAHVGLGGLGLRVYF